MAIVPGKMKVIEAEVEEHPSWPDTIIRPAAGKITDVSAIESGTDDLGKNRRRAGIYSVAGCFFVFLLVRALNVVSRICSFILEQESIALPPITFLSLTATPFFYIIPVILTLTVLYGIFRKSERALVHSLGIMLLVSVLLVLFQTLGIVAVFMAAKGL